MEATIEKITLQTYSAYKDSGVEWLGKIPEHWELTRLGTRFLERRTKVSDKDFEPLSVTKNGVFPQLASAAKSNDGDNRKLVKKGDFVINSRSDRKASSGISDRDGSVSLIYIVIEPISINSTYCNYLLRGYNFVEEFYRMGHGIVADLWTTRYDEMKSIMVGIPTIEEQTAIANFLDDKTTTIDQAIGIKQNQIALLKERRQILIHKAVTRGLNDNVKLKDSGVEWIGEIPEHWEVKKVTHLFDKIGSGTTPTSGDHRYYDGEYNFLQTGDLNDGKIILTKRTLKEKAFKDFTSLKIYPKGSLVMAMYGATIGKLGILNIEAATNQACCIFIKSDKIETEYFFQVLLAFRTQIISFGYGGGQPNISQDLIKSLRFPIAPETEQKQIVEFIETATIKIATAISLKEQEIEKLKEYKMSLIDGVVTGKVRVS
jgi:type I restriction enzyme S subunit